MTQIEQFRKEFHQSYTNMVFYFIDTAIKSLLFPFRSLDYPHPIHKCVNTSQGKLCAMHGTLKSFQNKNSFIIKTLKY